MQTISELTISLSSVELAISKLMLGERVVRVSNGDRMVEYGQSAKRTSFALNLFGKVQINPVKKRKKTDFLKKF